MHSLSTNEEGRIRRIFGESIRSEEPAIDARKKRN